MYFTGSNEKHLNQQTEFLANVRDINMVITDTLVSKRCDSGNTYTFYSQTKRMQCLPYLPK